MSAAGELFWQIWQIMLNTMEAHYDENFLKIVVPLINYMVLGARRRNIWKTDINLINYYAFSDCRRIFLAHTMANYMLNTRHIIGSELFS